MFQVGSILMNFTELLLSEDRCSMSLNTLWLGHGFCKRGLILVSFCYIYIPPHYLFDLLVHCCHCAVFRFFFFCYQKQDSCFFLRKHLILLPISEKKGEEESPKFIFFRANNNQKLCKVPDQYTVIFGKHLFTIT